MKVITFLIFSILAGNGYSQDVLIRNINVINVMTGQIEYDKTILVSDKKIKQISSGPIQIKNTRTVNGKGKFLIPGLWDMHVHTVDSSYLELFIINGVTGIRDMGGAAVNSNNGCESIGYEKLMNWRKLINSGLLTGPRILISGPPVSNTGWATSINIQTPEDARNAVKKLKSLGVDFIKVYEKIPLDAYKALAKEAKVAGLSIAGHVPIETVSLIEAAEAGQRSIEHIRDPLLMCFTSNREELLHFFYEDNWSKSDIEWGLLQYDKCPGTIEALKKYKTWLVPTLTVEKAKVAISDPKFVNDERRRILPKSVQQGFEDYVAKKLSLSTVDKKSDSSWWLRQKLLVTRMHTEGIGFMAGTDCACEGGLPGNSLHNELRLFVEAGFSPLEALQTATINPAMYLKATDSLGIIKEGKNADLVILNQNPLLDIAATESIYAVIQNGQLITYRQITRIKRDLKKKKNIR
ncbi:MAG: amidohydrolase family protein [Ferruginibacter sp.]